MTWDVAAVFVLRAALVALFVSFSVAHMVADFRGAREHAASVGVGAEGSAAMTVSAIALKVVCSLGILTGVADRLSALGLAAFCVMTALLYKRFWVGSGLRFWTESANLSKFWEFLKNVSLAAAFVLIAFGTDASSFRSGMIEFLDAPFSSSQPYGRTGRH
ncbi:DoxX family membrane protein [Blastomonas sp. UPD001]|uniref:DoxX family membrane protein n=1 Tax=Blastomonas sp. UPD001 TaxID=2217673 RepID=UPI000E34FAB5|nr:DoxX family membrane protein [Blastomonas sp. UPD001]